MLLPSPFTPLPISAHQWDKDGRGEPVQELWSQFRGGKQSPVHKGMVKVMEKQNPANQNMVSQAGFLSPLSKSL